jgi:hypothetical protein
MSIADLFNAALPGIAGVTTDVYTACIAIIGVAVIIFGVGVLRAVFTRGESSDKGGEFSEGDFQEYARGRYKRELYSKTYETRGIGKSSDLHGGE